MRLACWFESPAVALHPLQRRRAETIFSLSRITHGCYEFTEEVRDREDALANTRDACATQTCCSTMSILLIGNSGPNSVNQCQSYHSRAT